MSKCHHLWLLKGTIYIPGPPPSYIMDFAFVITVVTTTTFILSWYLIAPFSRGCVSAFLGEYVPYFFSHWVFWGFRIRQMHLKSVPAHYRLTQPRTFSSVIFQVVYFQFFNVHFCVFYKFIFKKLSTNFVPWLSVSYVHGNNHIYLPFSFIFCLNWQHCLPLFIVSNLPACWGYNGVYIILIILLIFSQNN